MERGERERKRNTVSNHCQGEPREKCRMWERMGRRHTCAGPPRRSPLLYAWFCLERHGCGVTRSSVMSLRPVGCRAEQQMSCPTHHFAPQFNVVLTMVRNRISFGFRFVPHPVSLCPIDAPSPAHPHRTCNILCPRPATAFPFPVCIFCLAASPLALRMAWLSLSLYLSFSPSFSLSLSLPPSMSLARSLSLSPVCVSLARLLALSLSLSLFLSPLLLDITQTIEAHHCPEVFALASDQVIGPSLAFSILG